MRDRRDRSAVHIGVHGIVPPRHQGPGSSHLRARSPGETGKEEEVAEIRANYGYADGTGEYYLTVDTDKCDGCGDCVQACPEDILELARDDYGEAKAVVKPALEKSLGDVCLGYEARCRDEEVNCHTACRPDVIEHTW